MKNEIAKQLYDKAEEQLRQAQEELLRPSSDVVSYSVCVTARNALHHFLNSLYSLYTDENNDTRIDGLMLDELISYCKKYDNSLEGLNFDCVKCTKKDVLNNEAVFFCDDIFQVQACTRIAERVKNLILLKTQ